MKRVIFLFVVLFSVIGGCYYLLCNKPNGGSWEILSKTDSNAELEDVPLSDWPKSLVGRWESEITFKDPINIQQIKGTNLYKSDGEFKHFYTYNHYRCSDFYHPSTPPEIAPSCLHVTTGGSYSGTWEFDTIKRNWTETILVCNSGQPGRIDQNYSDPELCKRYYKTNTTRTYGNREDEDSMFWIKKYSKNKIIIEGKLYSSDTDYSLILTRINEN